MPKVTRVCFSVYWRLWRVALFARGVGGDVMCTALYAGGCGGEHYLLEVIRCVLLSMPEAMKRVLFAGDTECRR